MSAPSRVHGRNLRRDIEGLRAISILAVVAFHARLGFAGGGYVGVDVFFVISGYLITSQIVREMEGRGRLSFGTFYARRARRLLPSSVLVIVATLAASAVLLPPLEVTRVAKDGAAAALYVANYRFAAQATNYLTASGPPSPLLHFWSLGVEEQFYLVWPALLLAASLVWRSSRRFSVRSATVTLAAVWVGSFSFSLWLTKANEPWAFYSLPTRAFELATGGLLALVLPRLVEALERPKGQHRSVSALTRSSSRRRPAHRRPSSGPDTLVGALASLVGWAGLGAIVWATVAYSSTTPFPGTAALAPVLGAAGVIVAGSVWSLRASRAGPAALLATAPMTALGRVSYTWYLWHWPVLVLMPHVVGHPLSTAQAVGACLGSLIVAVATSVLLERPAQRAKWLRPSWRSLSLAGTLSLVGLLAAGLTVASEPSLAGHGRVAAVRLTAPSVAPQQAGATTTDPLPAKAQALTAQVQAAVAQGVTEQNVPTNVTPPLGNASNDQPAPMVDGCFDYFTDSTVHPCDYGVTGSPHTMVLFGDSHAMQWFPAIDNIANQQGWHLIAQAKSACPPVELSLYSPDLAEPYTGCDQWRAAVVARIQQVHPAVVILGFSRNYGPSYDVYVNGPAWLQGLTQMINTLHAAGATVVVLGDDPYPQSYSHTAVVPDCLSDNLDDATACDIPKGPPAVNIQGIQQEQAAVTAAGATYVDTQPWFCTVSTCAVLVGNMLVYRDDNHISATYASWLTPVIEANIAVATRGAL